MSKFLLLIAALTVTACASFTIDEELVFMPVNAFVAAEAESDLVIERQEVFTGLAPFKIEIEAWENQRASIMFGYMELEPAQVTHGLIGTGDTRIAYTLISRPGPDRPLIVHCGGSTASRLESGTAYGLKLVNFGDALLFDYPGYGNSPGKTNSMSLREMNRRVAQFAKDLTTGGKQTFLWGHSLGGFVCAEMVEEFDTISGFVFEASARNAARVAETVPPWFMKPFVRLNIAEGLAQFDNVNALEGFTPPILVLGGQQDATLPVRLSQQLAIDLKDTGRDVTYVEFPEANHISIGVADTFSDAVEAFISKASKNGLAHIDVASLSAPQ